MALVTIKDKNGDRRETSCTTYPCGCWAEYCLCGCDNAPILGNCPLHDAAPKLRALVAEFLADQEGTIKRKIGKTYRIEALCKRARALLKKTAQQLDSTKESTVQFDVIITGHFSTIVEAESLDTARLSVEAFIADLNQSDNMCTDKGRHFYVHAEASSIVAIDPIKKISTSKKDLANIQDTKTPQCTGTCTDCQQTLKS